MHPESAAEAAARPPSLLVTTSGRIVEGTIRQSVGGYVVDMPSGRMLVPFEHVKFEAGDLHDAYLKYRRTLPAKTANSHLTLARWCITNELYEEAAGELREALHLEPQRDEARTMLRRLKEIYQPEAETDAPAGTPVPPLRSVDGFELPEMQSLAGLSREAAQEFSVRVQPMLLNKCGNAACHGSAAGNEFRLTHTRVVRSSRVIAERNLAATLRQIDFDKPDQSALLTVPRGNHGRAGRSVFGGAGGSEQFELLRAWVRQAAKQRSALARTPEGKSRESPTPVAARAAETQNSAMRPAATTTGSIQQTGFEPPARSEPPVSAAGGDLLERALSEERKDPFDPEEFNRATRPPN
jgi:hypothetical protein